MQKKTILTPDDLQMIAEYMQVLLKQSFDEFEKRQDKKFDEKLDKKFAQAFPILIEALRPEIRTIVKEEVGQLPTREEFFSRMDKQAALSQKHDQEMILLTHQYQRHDSQITTLENDAEKLKENKKKSI